MAVTAIWPIEGRADHVINYACNPEKTVEYSAEEMAAFHAAGGVVEYAADEMKTERLAYVTGLNCSADNAAEQFTATKHLWNKPGGRVCYHGYQSFREEEVTAEIAHEIGVRLARELWGDRFEVIVATHCNTGHYHNHLVVNSVSFVDGRKFYNAPKDYAQMRAVSDRLCREYGLSIVEHPQNRKKSYVEWLAEQQSKPTCRGTIRADIDRAVRASTTEREFIRVMTEMGYQFKTRGKDGTPLKYPALKPPGAKGYFRFHKLGDGYTLEEVKGRILQNVRKQVPFPVPERSPPRRYRMHSRPKQKITGIRALYFRYCYELHILVKHPASVKRVPFSLREDMTKLDRLDRETRFLARTKITTMDELMQRKETAESKITSLTMQRQALRNLVKRQTHRKDFLAADETKAEIQKISAQLKELRKETVLCDGIAARSGQVKENLSVLLHQKEIERKERTTDELHRRRGRTSRADEFGER